MIENPGDDGEDIRAESGRLTLVPSMRRLDHRGLDALVTPAVNSIGAVGPRSAFITTNFDVCLPTYGVRDIRARIPGGYTGLTEARGALSVRATVGAARTASRRGFRRKCVFRFPPRIGWSCPASSLTIRLATNGIRASPGGENHSFPAP